MGDLGVDTADAAAHLFVGLDLQSGGQVLMRKSALGDVSRIEREARILRGLSVRGVPSFVDDQTLPGVGRALVFTHPGTLPLEAALERGLRTDSAGGERFLRLLLGTLRELHALSPPVFHRNVSPHTVFYEQGGSSGRSGLTLVDFARATDVNDDAESDPVVARAGYAPAGRTGPVALDLYGAAATTVHLLTRTPLDKLPHDDDGRPRYREAANVSAHLASVLDRMLDVRGRDRFMSAEEALAALETPPSRKSQSNRAPVAAFAALAVVLVSGAGVGFFAFQTSAPRPLVVVVEPESAPRASVSDISRPPPPSPEPVAPKEPVPPPKPEPPPPVTRPDKPPHTNPAPPVSADQARIDALRRAIETKRADLLACAHEGDDRWRFAGEATGAGALSSVRARDKARVPSTLCAASVLTNVPFANKSGRAFTSEITIYLRPSFRVTVF